MRINTIIMKKTLLYTLLFLFISVTAFSQKMNREKIKLLKTSFITDALDFTSSEAEKFWPVYNLYNEKIQKTKFNLETSLYRNINNSGGIDEISEERAIELLELTMELEKQLSDSKIEMTKELSKVIPPKKVIKLHKAEKDFNKRILQEYGRRKKMQGNN